ncbi:Nucleic acid-binding protein [Corchorus olitorius]|uniref:Nucleic acid-binding protein n=1 Tax=Corchorus olitorius TaxID=93759 RepID=A0A1R3KN72_9ROSI|nr:Nucleic acid-binding protein [Corchorus olitorius]
MDTVLFFNVATEIEEKSGEPTGFPQYHFSFVSYTDIKYKGRDSRHLTDVIGQLDAVTNVTLIDLPNNKGSVFKSDLFLILLTGQKIRIRIWNPRSDDLDMTTIICLPYKPIIVVAGLQVRQYHGCNCINTCSGTRFYVDPDNKEAIEVRARFPYNDTVVKLISGDQIDTNYNYSYNYAARKTVEQLLYMNPLTIKI